MSMYQEIRNYITNNNFKLIYTNKYLNIINYDKIIILEDDKIEILISNKIFKIQGDNLKLKRIMNSELLVTGNVSELKMMDIWINI